MNAHHHLVHTIRDHAIALTGQPSDYTPLLEMIGDARFVFIGEATHGTEEFYRIRTQLTKKLIRCYGFAAVAVEADWQGAYRVNRYVRGDKAILSANHALEAFCHFPVWIWRNEATVEFLDWLQAYNEAKFAYHKKVGFYGLDLYGMHASIEAVITYLDGVDPQAAAHARHHYGCFDHCRSRDPQEYGYAATLGLTPACEQEALQLLLALQKQRFNYLTHSGFTSGEEFFCAEQNARLVVSAEAYYRTLFRGHIHAWNLRDKHMADTLSALAEHITRQFGEEAKIVVWAHNSHIGDAFATEMAEQGQWNMGRLVRNTYGEDAVLIGFSTYQGTVTTASAWDGAIEQKTLHPAIKESYEALFHETGIPNFLLLLRDKKDSMSHLNISRLQRSIGVLYQPETERKSHYAFTRLPEQFDAIIHLDTTRALKPLDDSGSWDRCETREIYSDSV